VRSATLVACLGWGDSGKGATVDALARRLPGAIVVRYNGGPQAAHNVWAKNWAAQPAWGHTFAQFGSGTFAGADTHLSRFMLVNPITWLNERAHLVDLRVKLTRTTVEEDATVITPYHRALNRIRELDRGANAHGTTGHGVGEAVSDKLAGLPYLTVGDLTNPGRAQKILAEIRTVKWDQAKELGWKPPQIKQMFHAHPNEVDFTKAVKGFLGGVVIVTGDWLGKQDADVIFEGAQGVLLDQDWGFHPHTTWSNCTFDNAEVLLGDFDGPLTKIGVMRSYMTRHGAGPFPTEAPNLVLPEGDNGNDGWAGAWRVGHPDFVMWRYAIEVLGGVDFLSLTHLDRVENLYRYAYAYEIDGEEWAGLQPSLFPGDLEAREELTRALFRAKPLYLNLPQKQFFTEFVESELGATVLLSSNGRTNLDRTWHLPPAGPRSDLMVPQYTSRWVTNVRAPILNS
jgi:adenylosuccinate synthase